SQGIKLSAEVKPFVPKHAAVTVAWSEPSEACVFPRYLTTCYPFVQEPSLDNGLGDPAFHEYSSCSYSPDGVANVSPVAGSQYPSDNSAHYNGSGIVSESSEHTYPMRQESKSLSKQRRSKESEKKLDKKRHDGGDSSVRIVNRTSFQTSACSRDAMQPDRSSKTANKKSTQAPKLESLPVPTFEARILDFHKSQSLGSSEILNVQRKSAAVSLVESNTMCLSQPQMSLLLKTKEDTPTESKASSKTLDETGANLIPSSFDGICVLLFFPMAFPEAPADGSAQPRASWAVVLSQPPKKIISSAASEGLPRGKGKQESEPKSETKNDASETEPEEGSEKKKKRKKKKKKPKSPTHVERPQSESTTTQEPPKIEDVEEFPDLTAASDRRNRLGSQKSSFSPAVRKQPEIRLPEEPCDTWSSSLDETAKVNGLSGKQASSSVLERKKMQETSRNSGKKSQIPVQLDLGGMLAVLEQKQQTEKSKQSSKPVVFSVGGAMPLLSKEPAAAARSHRLDQGKMPHNPLDSSAPLVKKGKQREVPKAKRPTPLKKIILKEREQRKQQHLLEQKAAPKTEDNVCQSAENITENETLLQDSQA
ncbi:SEBP2 protein, partial [Sapayoa aenigma]|nr:SEBP2 protein [Sapayoa aenigma]